MRDWDKEWWWGKRLKSGSGSVETITDPDPAKLYDSFGSGCATHGRTWTLFYSRCLQHNAHFKVCAVCGCVWHFNMENKSKRPFPPTTPPAYAPAGSQTGLFLSEWQSTLTNTHQHSHTHPIKILSSRVKEFQPKSFHSTGQSSVFFSRHGPQSFWPIWLLLFTYLLILSSCSHSFFTVSVILLIQIRRKKPPILFSTFCTFSWFDFYP